MNGSHVEKLEDLVGQLRGVLRELSDDDSFSDFLTIIHRPGWTTIAEWTLVEGGLQSMIGLATAVGELKRSVFAGARVVGGEEAAA